MNCEWKIESYGIKLKQKSQTVEKWSILLQNFELKLSWMTREFNVNHDLMRRKSQRMGIPILDSECSSPGTSYLPASYSYHL